MHVYLFVQVIFARFLMWPRHWLTGWAFTVGTQICAMPVSPPLISHHTRKRHRMKNMTRNNLGTLVAGVMLTSLAHVGAITTMQTLADGGTITSGNLEFYGFTGVTQTGTFASSVTLNQIAVVAINDGADYGIRFVSAAWDLSGVSQDYDLGFSFHVRTLDGTPVISGNSLSIAGGSAYAGTATISENVEATDSGHTNLANELVYISEVGGGESRTYDAGVFASQSEITVIKDFSMTTGGDTELGTNRVYVSHFDQLFPVPEAGSSTLLALGLTGLLVRRRRA